MKLKRIGIDLAKSVFQVHGVDSHERVQVRKQLMALGQPQRSQMLDFFRQVESPCVVAMEACGSSHYWGRELAKSHQGGGIGHAGAAQINAHEVAQCS